MAARACRGPPRADDGRVVRPLVRRSRPVGGHAHRRFHRRPRHETGALGRRQHPRDRGHRRRGRTAPDPPPGLGFRQRPDGHRGAAHAHVLRGATSEPRWCRVGAGRQPAVPAKQRAPLAVARCAPCSRPARARHRRRRHHPQHAPPRPERRVDAGGRRAAPDGSRSRRGRARRYSAVSPAGRRRPDRLRRLHHPHSCAAAEPRHEPQLPGRMGYRGVRQRRSPDERARDRCTRAGDGGSPQHLWLQRLPHVRRRAAATEQYRQRRLAVTRGPVGVEAPR